MFYHHSSLIWPWLDSFFKEARLIVVALPWLAYCFSGYAALLVVMTIWKRQRPKHAERWMKFLLNVRVKKQHLDDGLSNYWPVLFCVALAAGTVLGVTESLNRPVEEHNVKVFGQLSDGDWAMSSDEEGPFTFRPCPDFDATPMLKQGIGFIALKARWIQMPTCKSIHRKDLGFWWRDKNWNYVHIQEDNNARATR